MRRFVVKVLAFMVCLGMAATVCAENFFDVHPLYGKLSLGYEMRSMKVPYTGNANDYWTTSEMVSCFKLNPSVGMELFPEHNNFFLKGLAVEVGLDFGFGGKKIDYALYGIKAFAFTLVPGARAVWNAKIPNSRFIPRAFLGFEVPISIVSSKITGVSALDGAGWRETKAGFDVDIGVGVTFNLTEKIGILADFAGFFGTSNGFSFSLGASYRFK